ncbi:hypothetical protein GCM10017776_59930 [Streptomyces griseoluteus]|nr:hypothetical protein GCM10017776_59930 [Streptomyces griseoluteus]
MHKIANTLDALPKSAPPRAKKALQEMYNAEDRDHALLAVAAFEKTYGTKFPKAVKKITDDVDELLAFYDFPAEHWIHLRTTNPIETTFATVRLRTKVAKGAGSAAAALAMVFKLVESAQARWRAVDAPHLGPVRRIMARTRGLARPPPSSASRGDPQRRCRHSPTLRVDSLLRLAPGRTRPRSPGTIGTAASPPPDPPDRP